MNISGNNRVMDKQQQFLALYTPIHEKFGRYCLAIAGNSSDAKDIQSETIMKVYERFHTIENQNSFLYFLFRVASNLQINNLKRNQFFQAYDYKAASDISDSANETSHDVETDFLYAALDRLPTEQRDAIVLYEISGFKTEEIAEMQKCSPDAVRQRLVRGREKLKKLLGAPAKAKEIYSVFDPISALFISLFSRKKRIPISDLELDQLFEKARNRQPTMNLNEVALIIIGGAGTTPLPKSKFNFLKLFKNLMMTTIILSTIATVYFAFIPARTENFSDKITPIKKDKTESVHIHENQIQRVRSQKISPNLKVVNDLIIDDSLSKNVPVFEIFPIVSLSNEGNDENEFSKPIEKSDKNHNWPEDTTIDGRKFIVYLTDKELWDLGIYKDSVELYYNNKRGMSFAWIGGYYKNHEYRQKKNEQTQFDFSAEFRTELLPNAKKLTMDFEQKFDFQDFYNKNDTLVPVLVKASEVYDSFKDFICWFKPTKSFFEALPEKYKYLEIQYNQIKKYKNLYHTKNDVIYFYPQEQQPVPVNLIENVPTLNLTEAQLNKTGIIFSTDVLRIKTSWAHDLTLRKEGGSHFEGIEKYPVEISQNEIYPVQVTDMNGYKIFSWQRFLNLSDSLTINYQKIDLNKLILVKVASFEKGFKEDLVFWFVPTQKLLNSIDGKVGEELREEYKNLNIQDSKSLTPSSCTYFEVCRSTLNLDELKIYPNPANDLINMEFKSSQNLNGKISLVNISGQEIKVLENHRSFASGRHLLKLNIADVPGGIYLLTIYTDKGFRTQRVMISK